VATLGSTHVVAAGVYAILTGFEQLAASLSQGRALRHVADEFEDVLALEVAAWSHTVGVHEGICIVSQDLPYLVRCSDKELALNAVAVGILS
jgi:hypothetical protein